MTSARPRHFGIVVGDLDRSLEFYCGILGFGVARRMEETGPFIDEILGLRGARLTTVKLEATAGDVQIELLHFQSHPDPAPRPRAVNEIGPAHMALTVDDLSSLYQSIAAAGLPFLSPPRLSVDGRAKVAFCRDPDGTLLELVEPIPEAPR
jgi:catechol 2,3-dioxygenase-like lactoylglutathione lyase family enzyme